MSIVAEMLDLSRLPAPEALQPLAYETALAERKARLNQLFDLAGIEYDLTDLETDPAMIIEQADNYRELLTVAAVNDVYKQTLIAFAAGASLDHLAATFFFLARLEGETDSRFRYRVQLESENKSGGRLSGYKAECLKASLAVADVGAWVDRSDVLQPRVRLAIMTAAGDGVPPLQLVQAVQRHIDRDDVRQATDVVIVQPVSAVPVTIDVTLHHRAGPDPATLKSAAASALATMAADRRQPGRDLPLSAIIAAASVGGVERVTINSPAADVIVNHGQLVHVTANLTSGYTDG